MDSKQFKSTVSHDNSIKKLNVLRNEFMHFVPKSWSVDFYKLPELCLYCMEIIDFLVFDSNNILWFEEKTRQEAIETIKAIKVMLNRLDKFYKDVYRKEYNN